MKRLLFILTIFLINYLFSQQTITLDANDSEQANIYEARDYVCYLPGYHFSGQNGTMVGRINENIICDVDYKK